MGSTNNEENFLGLWNNNLTQAAPQKLIIVQLIRKGAGERHRKLSVSSMAFLLSSIRQLPCLTAHNDRGISSYSNNFFLTWVKGTAKDLNSTTLLCP